MITGRFDGPLIVTLSAVKHLGKDNNSQFYDTVGLWGTWVSLVCLFDLTEQSEGRKQFLGQPGNHAALSTNTQFEMESGCFNVHCLNT